MALKSRNKVLPSFNMSSMADLIFLLLIFFIITSTLIAPQGIKLLLPNSSSKTLAKQNVTVSITEDIEYYVAKKRVTLEDMAQELKRELGDTPEATLILKAHKSVAIEYIVKIMDVARENKYKVVLATKAN